MSKGFVTLFFEVPSFVNHPLFFSTVIASAHLFCRGIECLIVGRSQSLALGETGMETFCNRISSRVYCVPESREKAAMTFSAISLLTKPPISTTYTSVRLTPASRAISCVVIAVFCLRTSNVGLLVLFKIKTPSMIYAHSEMVS